MAKDIKSDMDEFVKKYGTGVKRRGSKGDKVFFKTNENTSTGLCELIIKNARTLIIFSLKNVGFVPSSDALNLMEEVFYDNIYMIIADYEPERYAPEDRMSFSNFFILRMGRAFKDRLKSEKKFEEMIPIASEDPENEKEKKKDPAVQNTDFTEEETGELILQFCSLLYMTLKNVSPGKSRMYRMFYTELYIKFCEESEHFSSREKGHFRELWDNLDDVLLSCIFRERPKKQKDIAAFLHKTGAMLRDYYGPYDEKTTVLQSGFLDIFKSMNMPDEEIDVPLENRIFIASDFIRQHDVEGISEPRAKSNAYITQSKKGKLGRDGTVIASGFEQIKEEVSVQLGII